MPALEPMDVISAVVWLMMTSSIVLRTRGIFDVINRWYTWQETSLPSFMLLGYYFQTYGRVGHFCLPSVMRIPKIPSLIGLNIFHFLALSQLYDCLVLGSIILIEQWETASTGWPVLNLCKTLIYVFIFSTVIDWFM